MQDSILTATLLFAALSAAAAVTAAVAAFKNSRSKNISARFEEIKAAIREENRQNREETTRTVQGLVKDLGEILASSQNRISEVQDKRLSELSTQLSLRQETLQKTVNDMAKGMDTRFASLIEQNEKKLEQMRATVDEKLQKTLEERIGQSFKMVSERLEQVYRGLGEMQTLAAGVGDLKKVLSNVKTRGILGEIQLGAILEQILAPEQYETNVVTKPGSGKPVEYAVKLPGDSDGEVYLPIDSKFPADVYQTLVEAYDTGDAALILEASKALDSRIKQSAKDIRDKYIDPPHTTDFAIMFLPFEGLYAEVVRRGLVETLQNTYKINIAGPTTMAALLNSLQMGFRTLAIQKRSGEVWKILGAVKTEFERFSKVLAQTQERIRQADNELDRLVGVRTRQIERQLRSVVTLSDTEAKKILDTDALDDGADENE